MPTLTETEFEVMFHPRMNDENYWEFDEVKDMDYRVVWTVVETGDPDNESLYALPGFHIVNRLGYLVSDVAWDDEADGDVEAVWDEADMTERYANADFDHAPVFVLDEPDRCGECGYLTRKGGSKHGVPEPGEDDLVVTRYTGHGLSHEALRLWPVIRR